jgi:signal transduction histidine kinase
MDKANRETGELAAHDEASLLALQVLDSITAEVAVLDREGTIVAVNDAWNRFAEQNGGSARQTGVGVNYLEVCRSTKGFEQPTAEVACQGIQQVLDGSREIFKLEYPCHSPSEKRWFMLYVSRLKAQPDFVVTTHLSITDRKLTEQKLVESERLAAIGEAMRGLSHEGRNALQRAQAGIELLRLQIEDNEEALELLQRIESGQNHLLNLYEEVTNYAAPICLHCEPYPLNQLVDEVWTSLARRFPTVKFIHLDSSSDLTCEVDVLYMRMMLKSAFENALVFEAQGLEIEVSYRENELNGVPTRTVIISDNQRGVPREDRELVFKAFYTTKTKGTGLGLAVSRRIVEAHHGRIYFGTPLRKGASLYVELPRSQPVPPSPGFSPE